jgi:hypothetical protein
MLHKSILFGRPTNATMNGAPPVPVVAVFAFAALFIAPLGGQAVFGQCEYFVSEIVPPSCPFGGPPAAIATALNNLGEVVGHRAVCAPCSPHCDVRLPFFWSEKTGFVPLPLAEGFDSARPYGVNDHRQIVGEHRLGGGLWYGFMYDMATGEYMTLPSKHDWGGSIANSINNSGIVAGARAFAKPGTPNPPRNAVIWDTNTGEILDLGVFGGPNSWSAGINESHQATGGVGTQFINNANVWVRLDDENIILTGHFPGGQTIASTGISAAGTVVVAGQLSQPGGPTTQSALWRKGKWELLPHSPGATGAGALAINDAEQVTGRMQFGSGVEGGVLWQHGEANLLADLLAPGHNVSSLERGQAINNAGQILVRVANIRAALLTPVDVPLGDLNYDCRVDVHDLWIMFDQWGPVPRSKRTGPNTELNGDGVVNVTDLLILFDNWTN